MLDWMKNKLESRLQGEISITSDMQVTPPFTYGRKVESEEKLKSLLMKMKEESEKVGLKLSTFIKPRSWHLIRISCTQKSHGQRRELGYS